MTSSHTHNDRFPTDPTQLAALLLLTTAILSQLTADQVEALTAWIGLAATVSPWLPQGGR